MKILILSPHYFPNINPRAHRWTSIAEHWAEQGHEVHLICSKNKDFLATQELNKVYVHRTGFNSLKEILYHFSKNESKRGEAGQKKINAGKKGALMQWFNDKVLRNLYFPDDAFMWYHPAKNKGKELLQSIDFDLMISSSVPFTTHLVALKLKKSYPNLKWIADTGDPFAFQALHPMNNYFLYGKLNKRLEKKVARAADYVTLTNEGAKKLYTDIFPKQKIKFKVIPPLYKSSISDNATTISPRMTYRVRIGYFGSFFKNIREPRPMLQFWTQFLEEHPELKSQIELHFYGNIFENFLQDFADFPSLQAHIFMHGMLSKEKAAEEMQQMDFLLNVGNATTFQLPSKSVDYLASGKPIINFCSIEEDTFYNFLSNKSLIINVFGKTREIEKVRFFLRERKEISSIKKMNMQDFSPAEIANSYLNLV